MPALVDIPTQTFGTRAAMDADRLATPWFQNRYVVITDDELYGGGFSFHLFRNGILSTIVKPINVGPAGIPPGGLTDQILAKKSNLDYDTHWVDAPVGGAVETFALLADTGVRLLVKPGVRLKY